jgi:hypothetical protein
VGAEYGRSGLRRPGRRPEGAAVASVVRPWTLAALLVLGLLFVAASWVDAGTAASPDPHPSAEESNAPAPDPYGSAPSPASEPATEPVTEPVTPSVVQVETTPTTGDVTRTPAQPRTDSTSGARTQKTPATEPEKTVVPNERRREPVRLAVSAPDDGGPLLLGGLAMAVLALASGSLLFLVTRSGNAGVGRWEAKP